MRLNTDCNGRPGKSRPRLEVISWMNSDEGWLSAAAARGTQENDGAKMLCHFPYSIHQLVLPFRSAFLGVCVGADLRLYFVAFTYYFAVFSTLKLWVDI